MSVMTTVTVSMQSVLTHIYATAAMATLGAGAKNMVLLQPDHEPALRRVVSDAVHVTAARSRGWIGSTRVGDTSILIDVHPTAADSAAQYLPCTLAVTTVEIISRAAGNIPALLPDLSYLEPRQKPLVAVPFR